MSFDRALDKLWPKASGATRAAVKAVAAEMFPKHQMGSLEIAHFMAQISHECGGGTIIRENMNYSAKRMLEVFGVGKHSAKITPEEAQQLQGHPQAIAERVYGLGNPKKAKELGNTRPGDGWRFRGGGMLQLTGGANYKKRGDAIGYDLYNNPDSLNDPKVSCFVALAEFVGLGCLPIAAADDGHKNDNGINAALVKITVKVNGGTNGLAERAVWFRRWMAELSDVEEPAWQPREGEEAKTPSLLGTRTGQIATATGIASAVGTGSQIVNTISTTTSAIQTTTDTITDTAAKAKGVSDQVVVVYQTVKPFLGLMPETWHIIAICAGVAVLAGVGAILLYRHWKIQETGA